MTGRSKRTVLLGLGAGALLAFIGSTQTWVNISLGAGAAAVGEVSVSGAVANPALTPITIATGIAAVVLAIAGRVFRYVLGVLALLFGLAIVVISWVSTTNPVSLASSRIAEVSGLTGERQTEIVQSAVLTFWPWLTVCGGLVAVVAGAIALLTMQSWPVGGRKYESRSEPESSSQVRVKRTGSHGEPDRIADWDAQNDGDDPTNDSDDPTDNGDEPPTDSQRH